MSSDAVMVSTDGGIARIRLNDPDRRNAWSPALLEGLADGLERVESSGARCLVLEAAGEAFSAGGDIEQLRTWREDDFEERLTRADRIHREVIAPLVRFPLPTIAKVDGAALGGGATLAAACDLQVASERTRIGFVFRDIGLCIDSGTSYVLPRLVGENTAKHLVYTGRVLEAAEAAELGLFTEVHPTESFERRAEALVSEVADGPTVALRMDKRLLTGAAETPLEEALKDEALAMARVAATEDHEEGVSASQEGRDPEFVGR